MATARKYKIDLNETTVYHIVSSCVRHAWLCGYDKKRKKSYEHRRIRLIGRMHYLASAFFIDLLEHNILSNHLHLMLDVDVDGAQQACRKDIVERYFSVSLAQGYKEVKKWYNGKRLTKKQYNKALSDIEMFRERLISISWFMQKLKQPFAKEANREENMQGSSFWDGRFYSRGIYSDAEMIMCMIYIALNKLRAKMAKYPENDQHTALYERLYQQLTDSKTLVELGLPEFKRDRLAKYNIPVQALMPFLGYESAHNQRGIRFDFQDYCKLVDMTARIKRDDKRGQLDPEAQSIMERLGLNGNKDDLAWLGEIEACDPVYYTRGQRQQAIEFADQD